MSHWVVECYDQYGNLKWRDGFKNRVVTVGLNILLDSTFKTGVTGPTWFVGLIGNTPDPTYAAGDTMSSHAGWAESVTYSDGTRQAFTPGTISSGSVSNSASKATFNINGSDTLAGAFLANNSTKSGTSGTLYGEGNFDGGDQAVANLDIVRVTVTLTVTNA